MRQRIYGNQNVSMWPDVSEQTGKGKDKGDKHWGKLRRQTWKIMQMHVPKYWLSSNILGLVRILR